MSPNLHLYECEIQGKPQRKWRRNMLRFTHVIFMLCACLNGSEKIDRFWGNHGKRRDRKIAATSLSR